MKFIFLSGSFHSKSRSLAILKNIQNMIGEHEVETPALDKLPFYSEDLNKDRPKIVRDFLETLNTADGILICSPEYNHSIPAVLKNAIDWASRPAFNSVLKGLPVSIITQAVCPAGGARAQAHIKLILDSTHSKIHICHEMMVTQVNEIFDDEMIITHAKTLERVERHVNDFISFTEQSSK